MLRARLKGFEVRHEVRVTRIAREFFDNARSKGFDDDDLFAGEVNAVERVLGVGDVLLNHDGGVGPDNLLKLSAFHSLVMVGPDIRGDQMFNATRCDALLW